MNMTTRVQAKSALALSFTPTGTNLLQRRSTSQAEPVTVPPIVHEVLRSPGQLLDPETRAFMEPRFGHDFSQVRVHTDTRAAESARTVYALAYTVGRDVVFGAGQYAPHTSDGARLLAHELAHTVQQEGPRGVPRAKLAVSPPGDEGEREAAHAANILNRDAASSSELPPPAMEAHRRSPVGVREHTVPGVPLHLSSTGVRLARQPATGSEVPAPEAPAQTPSAAGRVERESTGFEARILGMEDIYKPVLDPQSREVIGYYRTSGGYEEMRDILGNIAWSAERPLETPLLDPIDFIPVGAIAKVGVGVGRKLISGFVLSAVKGVAKRESAAITAQILSKLRSVVQQFSAAGIKRAASAVLEKTAAEIGSELLDATAKITNPGKRMIEAAKLLSNMKGLTGAKKVEVMLEFFRRIGFGISKAGVLDKGKYLLMNSEDGRFAFQFIKDTGEILYGKFDLTKVDFVWTVLK